MELCLTHPVHGYYVSGRPLGAEGDFVTAPEISQMFGEMIGVWLAQAWIDAGRPDPVRLAELGPGRGTLMADALRAARGTGLPEAADLWFVETSATLRAEQAARHPQAQWAGTLEQVPNGPLLLVANEFFDALSVRQFLGTPQGWRERLLGADGERLVWGLSDPLPGPARGDWAELCTPMERIAGEIATRLRGDGGAALIIDYGYGPVRPAGPTLQAVRRHEKVDPLTGPGTCDLTWLVDFGALSRALQGLATWQTEQGAFLARMGIGTRAAQLAAADPASAEAVADALDRLTDAARMGSLFRVLAAGPEGAPPPPGF
jgi:SAM-dependent MidA family methyltransferase